jgi:hypothetical protein
MKNWKVIVRKLVRPNGEHFNQTADVLEILGERKTGSGKTILKLSLSNGTIREYDESFIIKQEETEC